LPVGPAAILLRVGAAAVSGLLLAGAFPDFDFSSLAWIALVPLLLVPPSRRVRVNLGTGLVFGLAFFLVSLFWLTTVTWIGWGLLSVVCALFPAVWYAAVAPWWSRVREALENGAGGILPLVVRLTFPVMAGAWWTAMEWFRGHVFTGFPWNLLGVSQWMNPFLLGLVPFTGVYGLSFLAVLVNAALAAMALRWRRRFLDGVPSGVPWEGLAAAAAFAGAALLILHAPQAGPAARALRVAAVQGCLPQARQWTEQELDDALRVYDDLSRRALRMGRPDLIVWPETAVPAPLRYEEKYAHMMADLIRDANAWFLIGTLDYRPPRTPESGSAETDEPCVFNSVFLIDADGRIRAVYDKVHIVPFGEFVPFERLWPWLGRWFGLGRSLTPGREFTIFRLPGDVSAGVNICYEDVFPEISRRFVLRGAEVLFTLTNDAWYAESAGARQHLAHAVFRAAETRRPLLRAGNNSDTCLILPDGRITSLLLDPVTGDRFVRGVRIYRVPVYDNIPLTFYTRYGDVFAAGCILVALLHLAVSVTRLVRRKSALIELITGVDGLNGS